MKARQILHILAILVLLLWGGTFVFFYATGRIASHVDVNFRTWSLIAGLGLCVLGLFNLANFRHREVCTHDHGHDDDHEHDHSSCDHDHHDHEHNHDHHHAEEHDHEHHEHEQPASAVLTAVIILTVPLLMAAHYSKDSFSADYIQKWGKIERQIFQMRLAEKRAAKAASAKVAAAAPAIPESTDAPPTATAAAPGSSETPPETASTTPATADTPPTGDDTKKESEGTEWGAFTMEDLERMVPKNSEGKFLLDVPQIFYTAGDEELMTVMEGIPVETVAQVMEETLNNPTGTRLKLFRLFIECCAADARPLSIPIDFGKSPPEFEELGWVKVIGKLHYANEDGDVIPLLQVESMEPTAEPMDMMMY